MLLFFNGKDCQALGQAAQGSDGAPVPGNVQKTCGCGTCGCFSGGCGGTGLMVGPDDLKDLSQPSQFSGSMKLLSPFSHILLLSQTP